MSFWRTTSTTDNDKNEKNNYQRLSQSPDTAQPSPSSSLTSSLSSFNIFSSSFSSRLPGSSAAVSTQKSADHNHERQGPGGAGSPLPAAQLSTSSSGFPTLSPITRGMKTTSSVSNASLASEASGSARSEQSAGAGVAGGHSSGFGGHSSGAGGNSAQKDNGGSGAMGNGASQGSLKPTASFENYSNSTADVWDATDLDFSLGGGLAPASVFAGSQKSSASYNMPQISNPISTQPTSLTMNRDSTISPGLAALNAKKQQREVSPAKSPSPSKGVRSKQTFFARKI